MTTYAAFLRAINVGGRAVVKMAAVRKAFVTAGCRNVRTYIASGNVVFESASRDAAVLVRKIGRELAKVLPAEPVIMLRIARDIERLVALEPFEEFADEPGIKLYVVFLAERPRSKPKLPIESEKERLQLIGVRGRDALVVSRRKKNGMYGFPNNFVEDVLGIAGTSRSWSTVIKFADFLVRGN